MPSSNTPDGRPLVFLCCASKNDPYYRKKYHDIIEYQASTASRILGKDNVAVVYSDAEARDELRSHGLPDDILVEGKLGDIWLRDPNPVGIRQQAKFKFRPDYLKSKEAKDIEKRVMQLLGNIGIRPKLQSDIILDGGNVVDSSDKAVVTSRVYEDNPDYSQSEIREELEEKLGLQVAVIPEAAGDTTGHSDGIVSFLDASTLAISPLEEPYRTKVIGSIIDRFGYDVTYVELPGKIVETEWRGFPTACGLHVNSLTTHDYIYVPWFSDDEENVKDGLTRENDRAAVTKIKDSSSKTVVRIPVSKAIGEMGGCVRCLSYAVDGDMADFAVNTIRERAGC